MSKLKRKVKSIVADQPLVWKLIKKGQEAEYAFNYHRFYGQFSSATASTEEVNLEFSSACNLRCRFCALDHTKPKVYMGPEVIDQVFKSLLYDKRFHRVKTVNLYNGGETLMHPRRMELFERINIYKKLFEARKKKFPKIVLLTNGMLLRRKLAEELLSLKVIDEIGFSLDGGSPEAFEELRVNARWEKFASNVEDLIRVKNEIDPGLSTFGICIVPQPQPLNSNWMHPDFQRIAGLLDSVEFRRLHDWAGQVDIGEQALVDKKGCSLLMKQLVVLPNGDVTVCCSDLNSKGVVGNIMESELYAIYKSSERMKYIRYLRDGRKGELELCKDCLSF